MGSTTTQMMTSRIRCCQVINLSCYLHAVITKRTCVLRIATSCLTQSSVLKHKQVSSNQRVGSQPCIRLLVAPYPVAWCCFRTLYCFIVDEEEGPHQEPCLGVAPYYTMQHDGVAMLMDQIPEIAVEALPLVESTMARAPSVSSCSSDEEAPVASSSYSHSGSRTPNDQRFPTRDSASSQHAIWGDLKASNNRGSERGDSD